MIDFRPHTGSAYANTTQLLIDNQRIAPLWDDLQVTSPGEDIFIDESVADEVTIRWKAHTYSGAHPVDFAVTLRVNGDIVIHYGPTNAVVTPTVGISDGTGSDFTIAQYDGLTSLSGANSIMFRIPDQMPEGMSLDTGGLLSGVPQEIGVFEPAIRLTDSLGRTDDQTFTLVINGAPGDYDRDGNVDLNDFAVLVQCLSGPGAMPDPALPATVQSCLETFDFDTDSDVDLEDMGAFEQVFQTP